MLEECVIENPLSICPFELYREDGFFILIERQFCIGERISLTLLCVKSENGLPEMFLHGVNGNEHGEIKSTVALGERAS